MDIHLGGCGAGGHLLQSRLDTLLIELCLGSQLQPRHLSHTRKRRQTQRHLAIP
jgi:hypothetical protein